MGNFLKILLVILLLVFQVTASGAQVRKKHVNKKLKKQPPPKSKHLGGLTDKEFDKFFSGSFLFSPAEVALIQKALMGKVDVPEQTLSIEKKTEAQIPQRRLIQVSGVLYRGKGDWIVWINNRKVTPNKLLPEILEIKVNNSSYVHLKWFDVGLNAVIAITMRPNQTYDITSGVLLPE